jgi:hypothetical protein
VIAFDELPAALRTRLPLDVRLYALYKERSEIPIGELGASTVGIKVAIARLVELGLLRREWSGNRKTPIRYITLDPETASLQEQTA